MRFANLLLLLAAIASATAAAEPVPVAAVVNIRDSDNEHSRPVLDKNTKNQPLTVAGKAYAKGLGTQADNRTAFDLNGAVRFTGAVGIDDATESTLAIRI